MKVTLEVLVGGEEKEINFKIPRGVDNNDIVIRGIEVAYTNYANLDDVRIKEIQR